jgi:hypothetical protein
VASRLRPLGMPVSRRTALGGLVLLLLLLLLVSLTFPPEPLQFTQFSGWTPPWLSVVAGPQGTVTYQVTLHNQSIIPIQVTGVEGVPGQPLAPIAVQVMPDEGGASPEPFRPFTLPPLESVYLLVTSPTVCGAEQDSLGLRYSILGISRHSDASFHGRVTVERFRCPWVGLLRSWAGPPAQSQT